MRKVAAAAAVACCALFESAAAMPTVTLNHGALTIDGSPYADIDGPIYNGHVDYSTGNIGYLVDQGWREGSHHFLVKGLPAGETEATQLGRLEGVLGYAFYPEGAPAHAIPASDVQVCSDSIFIFRGPMVARVGPSGAARTLSFAAPWEAAPAQVGDVCGTSLVLVRKPSPGPFANITHDGYDYALASFPDGRIIPFDLAPAPGPLKGENERAYYYDRFAHQLDYRRINGRTIVIYFGPDLRSAKVWDIDRGKSAVVFHRPLGLNGLQFDNLSSGVGVSALVGLTIKVQENVLDWLDHQP